MALRTLFFLNVTYDYALSIKAEHGPILKAIVKEHQITTWNTPMIAPPILKAIVKEHQITTHPFNPLRRRH